jgi:hypothetical protein
MKVLFSFILASMFLFGCSQQNNPVQTTSDPTVNTSQTPDFIRLPKRLSKSLQKTVSVTQFITSAQGGVLRLQDTYKAAPDSHLVTLDIQLEFKPGDLPYDASLSMSLDDELFITTVGLTFGPHGIVFDHPAKLTVYATGLEVGSGKIKMKLYYLNNNIWEPMPSSNAVYEAGVIDAHGKLPHFSQYSFGRVTEE